MLFADIFAASEPENPVSYFRSFVVITTNALRVTDHFGKVGVSRQAVLKPI